MLSACFLSILLFGYHIQSLYVAMKEGTPKCFISEVPSDTLIVGTFAIAPLLNEQQLGKSNYYSPPQVRADEETQRFQAKQMGVSVLIKILETNEEIHRRNYGPFDRFAITSKVEGTYEICLNSNTSSWMDVISYKLTVEFHTGTEARNYDEIAKNEHFSAVETEIRRLFDRATDIRKELNYQRHREFQFKETSDSTNRRATWWSVFQIVILILAAVWQLHHLKTFFKKRKFF